MGAQVRSAPAGPSRPVPNDQTNPSVRQRTIAPVVRGTGAFISVPFVAQMQDDFVCHETTPVQREHYEEDNRSPDESFCDREFICDRSATRQ